MVWKTLLRTITWLNGSFEVALGLENMAVGCKIMVERERSSINYNDRMNLQVIVCHS